MNIDLTYLARILVSVLILVWATFTPLSPAVRFAIWVLMGLALLADVWSYGRIKRLQARGIYPKGKPTEEDVVRLMRAGCKVEAIKVYRTMHRVTLPEAVAAVDRMV